MPDQSGAADAGVDDPDGAVAAPDASPVPASCSGLAMQPSDKVWTIDSGGRARTFRVHVPPGYDPAVPTPLVLDLHGLTSNATQQEWLTGMNPFADEIGFVAIHPQGVDNSWNAGSCCGNAAGADVDDVGFVSDLIDAVSLELCIDEARVYAVGMSNGGHMSYRLGCELSDRIAGIAPVTGVLKLSGCAPSRPVPLVHFHGTADAIVPYADAVSSTAFWAQQAGCAATRTQVFANGDTVCEAFDDCPSGAAVVLCTVDDGGHTWPGGLPVPGLGKTTNDISANRAMWQFFTGQPIGTGG